MIEGDAIDCMVALPGQLFYSTQIPACLWFLAKDKSNGIARDKKLRDRRGEILFIDAHKLGYMADRTRREFSGADVAQIADTYHHWREGGGYKDVLGFCKSASLVDIQGHGYMLTPGRYVGAAAAKEDDVPSGERMAALTATLGEQMKELARLEVATRENLRGLGYEL
jgi:type I restriction enzyme M protein